MRRLAPGAKIASLFIFSFHSCLVKAGIVGTASIADSLNGTESMTGYTRLPIQSSKHNAKQYYQK
jgi:hypothetical protein